MEATYSLHEILKVEFQIFLFALPLHILLEKLQQTTNSLLEKKIHYGSQLLELIIRASVISYLILLYMNLCDGKRLISDDEKMSLTSLEMLQRRPPFAPTVTTWEDTKCFSWTERRRVEEGDWCTNWSHSGPSVKQINWNWDCERCPLTVECCWSHPDWSML